MKKRLEKGTYGYIDKLKVQEWKKSAVMLAVPIHWLGSDEDPVADCDSHCHCRLSSRMQSSGTCHSGKPISFYREEAL